MRGQEGFSRGGLKRGSQEGVSRGTASGSRGGIASCLSDATHPEHLMVGGEQAGLVRSRGHLARPPVARLVVAHLTRGRADHRPGVVVVVSGRGAVGHRAHVGRARPELQALRDGFPLRQTPTTLKRLEACLSVLRCHLCHSLWVRIRGRYYFAQVNYRLLHRVVVRKVVRHHYCLYYWGAGDRAYDAYGWALFSGSGEHRLD
eukprot:4103078-Pyramimonas_sp.AAC.1